MPPRPLTWTHDPKITAAGLRRNLRQEAAHLLQFERIEHDPKWAFFAGSKPLAEDATPEERRNHERRFFVFKISNPLIRGIHLANIAWDVGLEAIGPAVARWADGALAFIETLERDLEATEEALGKSEQARNTLGVELAKTKTALVAAEQDFSRIQNALAREREHGVTLAQKHAHEADHLRRDLDGARAELASAQSERDAWKVAAESSRLSAESSRLSAESAKLALETLAAATRIPVRQDGLVRT